MEFQQIARATQDLFDVAKREVIKQQVIHRLIDSLPESALDHLFKIQIIDPRDKQFEFIEKEHTDMTQLAAKVRALAQDRVVEISVTVSIQPAPLL